MAALAPENRPKIFSHWGITGGDFTAKVGLGNLAKVDLSYLQTLAFNSPKTSLGEDLKSAYEEKYGELAGHNAFNGVAHAYDLVHLLAKAIEKAGEVDASSVRNALENLGAYSGAMKTYERPFSPQQHEALAGDDYIMLKFNSQGYGELN